MELSTEFIQLKDEVAALRRELAALWQFYNIESPGAEGKPALLHWRSTSIMLRDPN